MTRTFDTMPSPVGTLTLTAEGDSLTGLYMQAHELDGVLAGHANNPAALNRAVSQLTEYFAGTRRTFDIPLAPKGTDFQLRVWNQLLKIPFGETWSYGQLARSLGDPNASRAVGLANGRNPISIIIPCHRVIGADGTLTGYGGGIERKKWLLDFETSAAKLPFAVAPTYLAAR